MKHRWRDCVLGDEDLLTEILLRLPAKDALRCKSVCKRWRTIISDGRFCYRHTLGHPTPYPSGLIFCQQQFDFEKRRLISLSSNNNSSSSFIHQLDNVHNEFDDGLLDFEIQQSSNGLLLWKTTPGFLLLDLLLPSPDREPKKLLEECYWFYVTNPTTGSCVRIHPFDHKFCAPFSKPFLVYEPWKSPHYKIIFFTKVVTNDDKLTTKMKMSFYSSETGTWSRLDLLPSFLNDIDRSHAIYCNSAIHWFVHGGNSVYFDINSLCLKDLPGVPFSRRLKVLYFGECGGNLQLMVQANPNQKLRYDIWELREDYSRWILRYHVDLTTTLSRAHTINMLSVVRQPPNKLKMIKGRNQSLQF
ncbi:hypothetical protein PIB30_016579 [Stylosanthes scabra]|uniref:F-box domain-containing protein n=1 Tax=Stylosanthes scabra TaxID=79078 RepID=A0ABU6S6T6_9FABA|nr:hypothetical protein [Stylosanthes scabra]